MKEKYKEETKELTHGKKPTVLIRCDCGEIIEPYEIIDEEILLVCITHHRCAERP